ncbi:splicing factor 3b subunit 4 [Trichophyton tonsurans CBS 112818]|uniref:Splicing factor 3b subunit 4 n=1 Tax=Trichophyton tonsurans (strain CBS 112818) TaxID=647933 RepID=F2RYU9_TRIT1|nr:splicing factor 3b subunit 4 [Trichophyton tonsurans CBS 112818]
MSGARHWEQDKEATVYIGNLDERVTDKLVWELMLQAGRIVNVHLPKDRVTQTHQGYGFVEFNSEEDAEYASRIMNQVRLYGKPIRVNKASADKQKAVEVGAELFVGNLDPMVTEQVARDDSNLSKGYGFISFSNFEASDDAIANMNGQYLMNKEISVQYAYKKDGKGERHGDQAERMLAAQARKHNVQPQPQQPIPPQFAGGAPTGPGGAMNAGVQNVPSAVPVAAGMDAEQQRPPINVGPAPPDFGAGRGMPPVMNGGYPNMNMAGPLPHHRAPHTPHTPHPPTHPAQPLVTPPAGLPARPPPSQAGYGGPHPGFPAQAPRFGQPPPAGFAPPPVGGRPGPGGPPGQLPPGFQQQGYGRGR